MTAEMIIFAPLLAFVAVMFVLTVVNEIKS